MEINYCGQKLVVATQGSGLWEVPLLKADEWVMDGTQNGGNGIVTWDEPRQLVQDLRIQTGTTLEIIGTRIDIAKDVKIVVEAGASMIVDNSILTNGCGEMWEGIRVWGDATKNQYAQSGGTYHQGRLIVKNESVIEFARIAAKLGNDDNDVAVSGGFVKADDSQFRNNQIGLDFLEYTNSHPYTNGITDNVSYARNCHFITDQDLPYDLDPIAFIRMHGVDNIKITKTIFENINPNVSQHSEQGIGVYAEDASFIVQGCSGGICPYGDPCCASAPEGVFRNLKYGIRAQSISSARNYKVDNYAFENCLYGVYSRDVDFFEVTRNSFEFGYTYSTSLHTMGVFNIHGTQFRIEENTFSPSTSANAPTIGTYMWYIGTDNNEIYKNTFTDLNFANVSLGDNASTEVNPCGTFNGLAYFCNTQSGSSQYDIAVDLGAGVRLFHADVTPNGIPFNCPKYLYTFGASGRRFLQPRVYECGLFSRQ